MSCVGIEIPLQSELHALGQRARLYRNRNAYALSLGQCRQYVVDELIEIILAFVHIEIDVDDHRAFEQIVRYTSQNIRVSLVVSCDDAVHVCAEALVKSLVPDLHICSGSVDRKRELRRLSVNGLHHVSVCTERKIVYSAARRVVSRQAYVHRHVVQRAEYRICRSRAVSRQEVGKKRADRTHRGRKLQPVARDDKGNVAAVRAFSVRAAERERLSRRSRLSVLIRKQTRYHRIYLRVEE